MENTNSGPDVSARGQNGEVELAQGLALFNAGDFFRAHEAWEDWWRATTRPEKQSIQGMIQVAVALHHAATGNWAGACSVMRRGLQNLESARDDWRGMNLRLLRDHAKTCMDCWSAQQSAPTFKIIRE